MLMLSSYRIGDPRGSNEGIRIGAVRYLPRGVRKEEYAARDFFDVWLPTVAPSRELLKWIGPAPWSESKWKQFTLRYRSEMTKSTDSRQTIALLILIAARTPIAVGCYCADEARCHRSILRRLIEEAADPAATS